MDRDSPLSAMFHGPFKAYIDCDFVEQQIDLAIGADVQKAFTEYEGQYALFHPMFYYEYSYHPFGDAFVPPPLPSTRTRPLNEPYRLRKGVLSEFDLKDTSAQPSNPSSRNYGGDSKRRQQQQQQPRQQQHQQISGGGDNWRKRDAAQNPDRYVPPHQRPGADRRAPPQHHYNQNHQYQQHHSAGAHNGPRHEPIHPAPLPSSAAQEFPSMPPDQLALLQQFASMMAQQQPPQAPPGGFSLPPGMSSAYSAPPHGMKPTEFGPDGLPIRAAQPKPQFQDPAIVSYGAPPFGAAPFPFFPGAPGMPGIMPMPMQLPGMQFPAHSGALWTPDQAASSPSTHPK